VLDLVTNPVGTFLPGNQGALEAEWKRQMARLHGVEFDRLYTITNMPISRFLEFLEAQGQTSASTWSAGERLQPRRRRGGDVPQHALGGVGRHALRLRLQPDAGAAGAPLRPAHRLRLRPRGAVEARDRAGAALLRLHGRPVDGVLDASLHRGSSEGADVDDLTLMAGPGVRFGKKGGTIVYVRALAGLVRDRASIDVFDVSISGSRTGFGLLAGGGVDLPLTRSLAVRAQGDYLRWDSGGDEATCAAIGCPEAGGGWESGFRASAGIVFRFGTAR
jgi:opacity protein-like surface antigen